MKFQTILNTIFVLTLLTLTVACSSTAGSQTIEEKQRLARMHSSLAYEFMLNENASVAEGEAEEALRLNPTGVEPNYVMARVQLMQGRHEQAISYYDKALLADPYSVMVLNDYGLYLCRQGEVEHAMEKFDRAGSVMMNPRRMMSFTRAASCLIGLDEYARAEYYLLKALELDPGSASVLFNLARTSYNQNDIENARDYMDRYLAHVKAPDAQARALMKNIRYNQKTDE